MNSWRVPRNDLRLILFERVDTWWVWATATIPPASGQPSPPPDGDDADDTVQVEAPLDRESLGQALSLLDGATSAGGMPDPMSDDTLGRLLFAAIFPEPIRELLDRRFLEYDRITIQIEVPDLIVLPWESIQTELINRRFVIGALRLERYPQVVRIVQRPAASASRPLELPVQVMQLDCARGADKPAPSEVDVDVSVLVTDVFRTSGIGLPDEAMPRIFQIERRSVSDPSEVADILQRRLDVLHLSGLWAGGLDLLPTEIAAIAESLRTAGVRLLVLDVGSPEPETRGTLGRGGNLSGDLVVSFSPRESAIQKRCLELAHSLAQVGGPTVLVSHFPGRPDGTLAFYRGFYDALVHDVSIDIGRQRAEATTSQLGRTALVVGPRGEELLRLSPELARAERLRDEIHARYQSTRDNIEQLRPHILVPTAPAPPTEPTAVSQTADQINTLIAVTKAELNNFVLSGTQEQREQARRLRDAIMLQELRGTLADFDASRALLDMLAMSLGHILNTVGLRRDFMDRFERLHLEARMVHARVNAEDVRRSAHGAETAARHQIQAAARGVTAIGERLGEVDLHLNWAHESQSSVPLAHGLETLKDLCANLDGVEATLAAAVSETSRVAREDRTSMRPELERHVNTWLIDPILNEPVPSRQPLLPQQTYLLHVNIGPHTRQSTVVNPVPIPPTALEAIFRAGGDWLQIAVYSQDFEIKLPEDANQRMSMERPGSAMQRIWLPKTGVSQPTIFRVKPVQTGLVYLRICIYYRNQLLQALRLDARVRSFSRGGLDELPACDQSQRRRLARIGFRTIRDLAAWPEDDKAELAERAAVPQEVAACWIAAAKTLAELPDDPLQEVPGLGPQDAAQLRAAGLSGLHELGRARAVRVVEITGVTREQARTWLRAANRLQRLGYITVIEYSTSADFHDLASLPPRVACIFTNTVNGSHQIGVKLGEWDEVWGQDDDWTAALTLPAEVLGQWLDGIREQLDQISTHRVGSLARYNFAPSDQLNAGAPIRANQGTIAKLKKALKALAVRGRDLYVNLFPDQEVRKRLAVQLGEPGQMIHVARVTEGEVVPWAVLYDLDLDPAIEPEDVCLAPLSRVDTAGRLEYRPCGGTDCSLTANNRRGIVCPWGFWGYKHILEQPPQRVQETAAPRCLTSEICATGPVRICMNANTNLALLDRHEPEIRALVGKESELMYARHRSDVMNALQDHELHIIYFYCHAGVTNRLGWNKPYLSVGARNEMILPSSLQDDSGNYFWPRHPLVFINACESAGLMPEIMGSFIQVFAGQGAAGVIGTEVKVWEPLATVFAQRFFEAFLAGQPVGWILHELRLDLLRLYNPLGLIYTNYCSADLRLVRGGT